MKNIILETEFINNAIKKLAEASNLQEIAQKLGLNDIQICKNSITLSFEPYIVFSIRKVDNKYELSGTTISNHRALNITEILTYTNSITSFVENINENIALALTFIK
jgi:hypothetical protein